MPLLGAILLESISRSLLKIAMTKGVSSLFTAGGVLAVLLWSSTVCLCGILTAKLGALTAASFIYILAGVISLSVVLPRCGLSSLLRISRKRLLLCGIPFILYMLAFYFALGLAKDGRQLIEVGLINYFWPALILLFSVPMQGNKANFLLPIGIIVGLSGIFMASCSFNGGFGLAVFLGDLTASPLSYASAFLGAALWAVYSNFSRILEKESSEVDIPLYMLLGGLILLPFGHFFGESSSWDLKTVLTLLTTALFPGVLACMLWDAAARKGNLVFVSAFAYLIPLFSTIMTGLVYHIPLTLGVWIACLLVVAGAFVCHVSVKEPARGGLKSQ